MLSAAQPPLRRAVRLLTSAAALRAVSTVLLFVACSFTATAAWAQIYVVIEPDGTRRFTNAAAPGAEVFIETRFSIDPAAAMNRSVPFREEIAAASQRQGVDPKLVEAVIAAESAFDPQARSKKGAQGLMQLMPDTADRFGVANVWDPRQNIDGGTAYLGWLIDEFHGDLHNVLAAYNAGEGAVARHGGVPPYPETRQYIDRVLAYYRSVGGNPAMVPR